MDEVQALAKRCVNKYGGGGGGGSPAVRTPPVTPPRRLSSRSIPTVPSFAEWTNGSERARLIFVRALLQSTSCHPSCTSGTGFAAS